uniref:BRISC and BRCA1-A complex member 1 n=1 Tax=Cyprinus carpio TaxID=7962 RepID=A0A8C2KTX8_CYPCA
METPEPGQADGEERMVELRPRTRSNPEGAEDRRSSTGSLNNSLASPPQPAVGSRVEGEGEAASSDSPPTTSAAVTATGNSTASLPAMAPTLKERPKPPQQAIGTPIPPSAELHLRAPRVNCPEKVIICLDLSEEMSLQKLESFNGSKTNALNISQKMIEMFVRTKHKIDKRHEFALVVVNDDAMWLSGFTSDPRELCSCLYDLETNVCESFNLEDLLSVIMQKIELPQMENIQTIPPPFVVRTLLIFSRHAGMLQFNPSDAAKKMLQSPYFFFDVVYLHNGTEEQTEDTMSWTLRECVTALRCHCVVPLLSCTTAWPNCCATRCRDPSRATRPTVCWRTRTRRRTKPRCETHISWMHNHRLIHSKMKE